MRQPKTQNEKEDDGEQEILDFNKPDFQFIPKGNHEYRQQGPYLTCKSCDLEHAVWIGVDKQLIGFDDKGQPIVKKL